MVLVGYQQHALGGGDMPASAQSWIRDLCDLQISAQEFCVSHVRAKTNLLHRCCEC